MFVVSLLLVLQLLSMYARHVLPTELSALSCYL